MTRPPPHSLDAERAVIAALLLRPEGLERAEALLRPGDFYHPQHEAIYGAALELHRAGQPVDVLTLHDRLASAKGATLEVLTGFTTPTVENIEYHAGIVREKATLRRLIRACHEMEARAFAHEEVEHAEGLVTEARAAIDGCYREQIQASDHRGLMMELLDDCEYRWKHPEEAKPLGVPTGYDPLDGSLAFEGLPKGHVTIIAAETGKGKSALAQGICRGACRAGFNVLDVTLEDRARARQARHVSAITAEIGKGIQNMQLQRRMVKADEWQMLMRAAALAHKWKGTIHYLEQRLPVDELLARAGRLVRQHEISLVVIDYLQLLSSGQNFRTRQEHVDYVFDRIEHFATAHQETATILVSQMARHEGRPKLSKLYHSARLEQGAHTVMLLWAPALKTRLPYVAIDIAKQKDGPTGIRVLGWEARTVRFYNPTDEIDVQHYLDAIERAT